MNLFICFNRLLASSSKTGGWVPLGTFFEADPWLVLTQRSFRVHTVIYETLIISPVGMKISFFENKSEIR